MGSMFLALALTMAGGGPSDGRTPGKPYLDLEKAWYFEGGPGLIWVGVITDRNCTISPEFHASCFLHITDANGQKTQEPLAWPNLGMTHLGWTGGYSVSGFLPSPGVYTLEFEFAGQMTPPKKVTILARPKPGERPVVARQK